MAKHVATALDADVAEILRRGTLEGSHYRLPADRLDRAMYVKVNAALEALGGKWNRGKAAHVFATPPDLDAMLSSGKVPPKNADAFFPTPGVIAEMMIELAGMHVTRGGYCLEPSAGLGAIALRVPQTWALHCVEIDAARASALAKEMLPFDGDDHRQIWGGDFLTWPDGRGQYDRILMNPPFAVAGDASAWMTHTSHALTMLDPQGVLVSVVPSSYAHRSDKKHTAFRASLAERSRYIELPADSFAESGTGVNCGLLIVQVPIQEQRP